MRAERFTYKGVSFVSIIFGFLFLLTIGLYILRINSARHEKIADSPDGRFRARAFNWDAGAVGAGSAVQIFEKDRLPIWLHSAKAVKTVFSSGAGVDFALAWKDPRTLLVATACPPSYSYGEDCRIDQRLTRYNEIAIQYSDKGKPSGK